MEKNSDLSSFVGPWSLISSYKTLPNGDVINVWGESPVGYLIYTEEGVMGVQIMRTEPIPPEQEGIVRSYLAYSGRYEIDESSKIISHKVELSITQNFIFSVRRRMYRFLDNDRVELRPLEQIESQYILIWERVR